MISIHQTLYWTERWMFEFEVYEIGFPHEFQVAMTMIHFFVHSVTTFMKHRLLCVVYKIYMWLIYLVFACRARSTNASNDKVMMFEYTLFVVLSMSVYVCWKFHGFFSCVRFIKIIQIESSTITMPACVLLYCIYSSMAFHTKKEREKVCRAEARAHLCCLLFHCHVAVSIYHNQRNTTSTKQWCVDALWYNVIVIIILVCRLVAPANIEDERRNENE